MSKYKLSICIPTYNREKFISDTIQSIIKNNCELEDIEIVVSDNASTDNTKKLIESFRDIFPNITYFCWDKNMGADKNYLKTIEIASGEYCWFMGSDDTIKENSLEVILNNINLFNADIFLCNRTECNFDMKPIRNRKWLSEKYTENTIFKTQDLEEYFNNALSIGAVFSYLSSIIVKKESWESIDNKDLFVGTAYSHVYVLMSILIKNNSTLGYITDYLVNSRGDNDSFAQDGLAKRIMLDIKGYIKLKDGLSWKNEVLKNSFLSIVRKERPLSSLVSLRRRTNCNEWLEYESWLYQAKYNKAIIFFLRYAKVFLNTIFKLKSRFN